MKLSQMRTEYLHQQLRGAVPVKPSQMSTESLHQQLKEIEQQRLEILGEIDRRQNEEDHYPVGTILKLLPNNDDAFVIKVAGISKGYDSETRPETEHTCWVTVFRDFSGDAKPTLDEVRRDWPIHDLSVIHKPVNK